MTARWIVLGLAAALIVGVQFGALQAAQPVDAAAQAGQSRVGPLAFSSEIGTNAQPVGIGGISFPSDNNGVWVSFDFDDLPPGSVASRIVRVNGDDFNWDAPPYGSLNCCQNGGSGRFAFRVLQIDGDEGELPGGAYFVEVHVNTGTGTPLITSGGFGIAGDSGSDEDFGRDDGDNGGGDND